MDKKYVVFIDIDGTLYDAKQNCIPASSLNALAEARKNGHKLFICTGRPFPDVNPEYFHLPIDGFIISCGAHIILNSETIYKNPIPIHTLKELVGFMTEHNIGFSLDGLERNYLFSDAHKVFRRFECRNMNVPYTTDEAADLLLAQNHMYPFDLCSEDDLKQITKISIFTNNTEDLNELFRHLPDELHGYIEGTQSVQHFAEITLKENSKSSGIDIILKTLNLPLENTIAIGDGNNDIDMINYVHFGVAMGNSCEELKAHADYITKNIDEDGLAHAFRYLKLIS